MSHLYHVKQMYRQSIHLAHESILCIQIIRGRVHFNRDSTAKSLCWHQVLNQWPSYPGLWFAAIPSLPDLVIFMAPQSRGPIKVASTLGTTLQQSPASCPEHSPDFPRACTPWKSLPPICLAYMLLQQSQALVFFSCTWSSQAVQCCLTSVIEWELVFPTWHGPLTSPN